MPRKITLSFDCLAVSRRAIEKFDEKMMKAILDELTSIANRIGLSLSEDEMKDPEDWIEAAFRCIAFVRAADSEGLTITQDSENLTNEDLDVRTFLSRQETNRRLMGSSGGRNLGFRLPEEPDYSDMPIFLENAGREVVRTTGDTERHPDLPSSGKALLDILARHGSAGWKATSGKPKDYPFRIFKSREDILEAGMDFYGHGGRQLVQEVVPMGWETRFFVVDGKVISGAGCVESHTPANRLAVIDGKIVSHPDQASVTSSGVTHIDGQEVRNKSTIEAYAKIAETLESFAHDLAEHYGNDETTPLAYTLDLYINRETGNRGVVEINPIINSGLYANDPIAIGQAIVSAMIRKLDRKNNR